MKTQYVYNNNYFLDEECFLELLNQYSQKGYKLKKAGLYLLYFEKTDKPIYYHIDYNYLSKEYLETLKDMGYTLIDNYKQICIFETDDPHATALQSDEETKKIALLELYKISDIFLLLIAGFLLWSIFHTDYNYNNLFISPGAFYRSYDIYFNTLYAYVFLLLSLITALRQYLFRYFIQKNNIHHPILIVYKKIYDILATIILVYFTISIIITISTFHSINIWLRLVAIVICVTLYQYGMLKWSYKIKKEDYRRFLQFIILCIFIISNFFITAKFDLEDEKKPDNLQTYYTYDSNSTYKYQKNVFLTITNINHENNYESIYNCINNDIAIKVYQNIIQEDERFHRLLNNEFNIDISEIGKVTGLESQPYKEFKDIIPLLEKIKCPNLDDCYWYDDNIYMRKDSQIIVASLKDKSELNDLYHFYFH